VTANGSVVWFVAVCPGVARFLPIPVDGVEVMCHGVLCKLLAKTLTRERRPAGLLALSWLQDLSR